MSVIENQGAFGECEGASPDPPEYSETTRMLAETDLARSGLTLAQAYESGMFAVDDASAVNPDFRPTPGVIIPYFDSLGRPLTFTRNGRPLLFCRVRYLRTTGFLLPNGRKYDQPADSGTPPYFPPCYDWARIERGEVKALVVTEGEKKALALCHAGIPTLAIGGVWNFTESGASLHSDIAAVAAKCGDTYLVFDSDKETNTKVQSAEWRLAGQLALLGVRVHLVRIPPSGKLDENGRPEKVGADDFLVQHGAKALIDLILSTPALGEKAASADDDVIPVADLLNREVMAVEELIPGFLEKGIPTFIAGKGGVHKSRLALQWGLCLNAGKSIWGLTPGTERLTDNTLVYCAAEDDANELARRAQAISKTLGLKSSERGVIIARKGKNSALVNMHEDGKVEVGPFYHELMQRLRSIPGHKIVVLDSAYDFVRFAGRAKIVEDVVNNFIKVVLQGICDQCDATLLIPWHPSQAGSERGEMDGWSVAWHNAARGRLSLKVDQDVEDTYVLEVTKRNHGPKGQPIKIRFQDGALLPLDAIPDDGKDAALQQVVVNTAIDAANKRVPCNRRHINEQVIAEAAKVLGKRPSRKMVLQVLELATAAGKLSFIGQTRHRAAGFYPPDAEVAQTLAKEAKRAAQDNVDA
jgi:RecA-family ATPase